MIDTIIQLLYYLLFLFTPLVMFSRTSELFEFNKMLFIYLITILVVFFWIIQMIFSKKIILKKTVFDIPILIFLGSQIASTIFSIDRHTSFFGYYGRFNGGLLSIIAYVLLFYGLVAHFRYKTVIKVLKVSLLASFVVILWGLPGKVGHDLSCLVFVGQFNNACWTDQFHPESRMFSTLGQPNWLGAYLAVNFFIGLYFFIKEKQSHSGKIFSLLYLLLNFSAILFTKSRSSLASVIVGLVLLLFFFRDRLKKIIFLLLILLIPIFIFKTGISKVDDALSLVLFKKQSTVVKQQSNNVTMKQSSSNVTESFDIRKIVWKGAIDLGLKYPITGTGVETFAYSYYFVRLAAHNLTSEWDYLYNKAHNEFLNYLATTGFVGLAAYILFIGSFIILSIRKLKTQNLVIYLLLAYFSILITNFFGFSTTTVNLFFYLIPGVVLVLSSRQQEEEEASTSSSLTRVQLLLLVITAMLTIFFIIYIVRYFLADIDYATADNYSKIGDYQSSAKFLDYGLRLKYEHVYEDKLSYILANLAFLASYQKQTAMVNQLMKLSDYYNQKSIMASPKNVFYWKTKAKNEYLFYQITLDEDEINRGIKALNEARLLAPTDPKIPYSLSIFYSIIYDKARTAAERERLADLSINEANTSIKLKSNFRDGYLLKAQLLKKYRDKETAMKTLQYILDNINPQDEEVKKEISNF